MSPIKVSQIMEKTGFDQFDILGPSPETKGRWVVSVKTSKGWKRKWFTDSENAGSQLAEWVNSL